MLIFVIEQALVRTASMDQSCLQSGSLKRRIAVMNTWIALRKLVDSLELTTDYHELDSISQRVLDWIYLRVQTQKPLFVQEIILRSGAASPATLHKCIAILTQRGLLEVSIDPTDGRRRQVRTSAACNDMMRRLGKNASDWINSLAKLSPGGINKR